MLLYINIELIILNDELNDSCDSVTAIRITSDSKDAFK